LLSVEQFAIDDPSVWMEAKVGPKGSGIEGLTAIRLTITETVGGNGLIKGLVMDTCVKGGE